VKWERQGERQIKIKGGWRLAGDCPRNQKKAGRKNRTASSDRLGAKLGRSMLRPYMAVRDV
jgi:hypothetical protein